MLKLPYDDWWQCIVRRAASRASTGLFVHPVADPAVMAGNGTIGLEILEDLPDVDAVVIPYGGGGLTHRDRERAARAAAADADLHGRARDRAPRRRRRARAGEPVEIDYRPSFVDGAGSRRVLADMWPQRRAADRRRAGRDARRDRRGRAPAGASACA